MKTQPDNTKTAKFVNPTHVHVSKDGRFLVMTLPGNQILSKPLNYFRTILDRLDAEAYLAANNPGEGA